MLGFLQGFKKVSILLKIVNACGLANGIGFGTETRNTVSRSSRLSIPHMSSVLLKYRIFLLEIIKNEAKPL